MVLAFLHERPPARPPITSRPAPTRLTPPRRSRTVPRACGSDARSDFAAAIYVLLSSARGGGVAALQGFRAVGLPMLRVQRPRGSEMLRFRDVEPLGFKVSWI